MSGPDEVVAALRAAGCVYAEDEAALLLAVMAIYVAVTFRFPLPHPMPCDPEDAMGFCILVQGSEHAPIRQIAEDLDITEARAKLKRLLKSLASRLA